MALLLERRIYAGAEEPGIVLLKDDRMLKQLCAVTNDLESHEVGEDHADAFWSVALAVKAAEDGPSFTVLGDWKTRRAKKRGPAHVTLPWKLLPSPTPSGGRSPANGTSEHLPMEQVIICRRSSLSSDGVQPLLGGVRVLLPLGSVRFVGGDNLVCP